MSTGVVPIDVSFASSSASENTSGAENTLSYSYNPIFNASTGTVSQTNSSSPSSNTSQSQTPVSSNPATAIVTPSSSGTVAASPGTTSPGITSTSNPLAAITSGDWLLILLIGGAALLLGVHK
jgi:cell division septation protein DedD